MLLPLRTDRSLRRTPVANITIMVITIVMFGVQKTVPGVESLLLLRPYDPDLYGIVGANFLHGGWMHLLGNMLFLYIFGNSVNDSLGNASYVGFYLAGGVASSLLSIFLSESPSLGASGAIAATTGAFLVLYPRSRIILLVFFIFITTITVPALWFVGIFFLLDIYQGFNNSWLNGQTGTAHWAHVGGSIYGMIVSLVLLRTRLIPRDRMDLLAIATRWKQRKSDRVELRKSGQVHLSAMDIVPKKHEDPKVAQAQDLRSKISESLDRGNLSAAAETYRHLLAVDERQILARSAQIEIANQLYRDEKYDSAATAYRLFLDRFGKRPDQETAQSRLILGLIIGRYLGRPEAARAELQLAADELEALGSTADADFARAEAEQLGKVIG